MDTKEVDLCFDFCFHSETGGLCAMKEVDVIPDDPKSSECIRQLEQVILLTLKYSNVVCNVI